METYPDRPIETALVLTSAFLRLSASWAPVALISGHVSELDAELSRFADGLRARGEALAAN